MDFKTLDIVEVFNSKKEAAHSHIAIEEPLQITVDNEPLATIMRTPGHDKELAVGFLLSEGFINRLEDIQMVASKGADSIPDSNVVNLKLKVGFKNKDKERAYEIRSSCGICGQKKIDALFDVVENIKNCFKINIADIYKMSEAMGAAQRLSKLTRGTHAAALFTANADIAGCFEDVGRHNALDKLIGHCLLNDIKMDDKVLLLSGRTSYEMLTKAIRCRIGFVASISAPSSLAIETAKRGNVALAGILRDNTMKIYNRADDFIS